MSVAKDLGRVSGGLERLVVLKIRPPKNDGIKLSVRTGRGSALASPTVAATKGKSFDEDRNGNNNGSS